MKNCKHYTLDCEQEKMGCKGCAYEKDIKTADEMFEELGFIKIGNFKDDRFIVYQNEINMSIQFDKQEKSVIFEGFNAMRKKDIELFQIKMEELEW